MTSINKLPASAGAQWLLNGATLFLKAPLQLARLALIIGMAAMLAAMLALVAPTLGSLAQLAMLLLTPVLTGGLVWAVREIEQQRQARPDNLLEGFRHGRLPHLLVAVLPYFLASLALGALLFVLLGNEGLARWQQVQAQINAVSQSGGQIEPAEMQAMLEGLPVFRILLWFAITVLTSMAIGLMLAFMLPQVMFSGVGGWAALLNSLRASLTNIAAMMVFYMLSVAALALLYALSLVVALVFGVLGLAAVGLLLSLAFFTGTALPLLACAIYSAWKRMFGASEQIAVAPATLPSNRIEL